MKPATPMTTATGDKYPKKKDKTVDDMKGMKLDRVGISFAEEGGVIITYNYESSGPEGPNTNHKYDSAKHVFTDKKAAIEHLAKHLS